MAMQPSDWAGAIGETWAGQWPRTDRTFAPVDAVLVATAAGLVADVAAPRILDVGCGAGTTSLGLAERLRSSHVTGIDLSPALVAAARARGGDAARCRFEEADATLWNAEAGFDLVVSRHGVMFFEEPAVALAHIRTRARPGAPFAFSCFRSPALNPWASGIVRLLPPPETPPDPWAPGPFAFADRDRVAGLLAAAGWRHVEAVPLDFRYVAGVGADPVGDALDFFSRIGPTAFAMRTLEGDAKARFRDGLEALLREHHRDGEVVFPGAAWIWTMRA